MGQQLSFRLPEVDREETKAKVEEALETYRYYLLSVPAYKLPKVTATYSLVPPAHTNSFHSSTEQAVIDKVDKEIEREQYLKWIQDAVNRLKPKEREIMIRLYMDDEEELYDYELYNELGMSETSFYKFKGKIFLRLAFALGIEIYKKKRNYKESPKNSNR